jgi:hypothetical protein
VLLLLLLLSLLLHVVQGVILVYVALFHTVDGGSS